MANQFEDSKYRNLCSEKTLQSNSAGFFLDFANLLSKEAGDDWVENRFGKLKTDIERIRCVYISEETGAILKQFLSNVQEIYRSKDAEFSRKKRHEGDIFMKQQEYEKALLVYCQSVIKAPKTGDIAKVDSGLTLALALWSRSQALIKLQNYSDAVNDIQQALKEKLPGSFKAESFSKMALCYGALGEETRAKVSFDLAEKLAGKNCEILKSINKDKSLMSELSDKKLCFKKQVCNNKAEIKGNVSVEFPRASDKLFLKVSKTMGRYFVANEAISTGETLVVESPYVSCLLPDMFGTHCHHCFKRLVSPFGCPDCSRVAFCTTECRNEAISSYHRYECKYLDLIIGSGLSIVGHAALRMITQNGLEKCLEMYENRANEQIYRLCTNSLLRPAEDFLQRTLMAAFLLRCLQKSGFFGTHSKVTPSETEYRIAEMILFNLQMLQFNAHEVYEYQPRKDISKNGSPVIRIGIGVALYPTASLFNHDCFPALSRHYEGKNIVLTTVRPLEKNEIVPENYGPRFTRKTLAERKRLLSSRYWFDCQCIACQQNWPCLDKGLETVSDRLKCPSKNCSQLFTLPLKDNTAKCIKCKEVVDLSDRVKLLKRCKEDYRLANDLVAKCDYKKAIEIFSNAIETFYRISLPPNKESQMAEETLAKCLETCNKK